MGLITLRHAHTHNATGTDPLDVAALFDGVSSSAAAAARVDLGAAALDEICFSANRKIVAGRYYGPLLIGTRGSQAQGAGDTRAVPFDIAEAKTFDRIGIEVTSSAASAVNRLGIYTDNNGRPGTLVLDAGTVDASSTGFKEITISQSLSAGRYWLISAAQTATHNIRVWQASCKFTSVGYASGSDFTGTNSGLVATGVTGALPSSAGTYNPGDSVPAICLRSA